MALPRATRHIFLKILCENAILLFQAMLRWKTKLLIVIKILSYYKKETLFKLYMIATGSACAVFPTF